VAPYLAVADRVDDLGFAFVREREWSAPPNTMSNRREDERELDECGAAFPAPRALFRVP
jgi:hypothetical protein